MDDLEQKMKEKLLEGLIEHMDDKMAGDLKGLHPKAPMEVTVGADDPKHLAVGLAHAKELAESHPEMDGDSDEDSDEDRLMELLGKDDDDDESHSHR